jgi:hypothetical protein
MLDEKKALNVTRLPASRWISRGGWLLTVSTILTAVSLVPILDEGPELKWLECFGIPGSLLATFLFRFVEPSAFIAVTVVGLFANTFFLAVLFGLVIFLFERRKMRSVAQA